MRFTQADIACKLGITPGAYSKIESGPTEITVEKLAKIASLLKVDIVYFFNEESTQSKFENPQINDFATKKEVAILANQIKEMQNDLLGLKKAIKKLAK